jgi:NTP pyrophosphatase (non-canonical NTP hydrolase)
MNDAMTFGVLRAANVARLPRFKNRKGEPAHSQPDGSDWALSTWSNAVLGELGELANMIKKIERGDITLDEAREACGKECADVATYLDILAFRLGVDLGQAVVDKFNEVSDRVGADIKIDSYGDAHDRDEPKACVIVDGERQ